MKNTYIISFTIILSSFTILSGFSDNYQTKDYNYDVTMHRDTWGVPHIYGQSDLFSKHKMKDSFIRFNGLKDNIKTSYTP